MCYLFLCKLYSFKKYKIILWNYFIEFLNNTFCQIIIVMTYLHTELWLVFILAFIFIVKSSHFMLTTAKFKVAEMRHFNYEEPKPETQPKPESQPKTLTFFFFCYITSTPISFWKCKSSSQDYSMLSVPCHVCLITIHSWYIYFLWVLQPLYPSAVQSVQCRACSDRHFNHRNSGYATIT